MDIVPWLFGITFLLALVIGVWQLRKVRQARRQRQRSAAGRAAGEPWSRK